jgi:molybdate transport system regulatory protein
MMQQSRRKLSPSFKVWLITRDRDIIGKGGAELLRAIRKHGSIRKAAMELGFSYKFAWSQLEKMEKRLGGPLVTTERGGVTGGGARLTRLASTVLEEYEAVEELVGKTIQQRSRNLRLNPS